MKNIRRDSRKHQCARALAESVANHLSVEQPQRRRIVLQHQQSENSDSGYHLNPGKHHLPVHNIGEVTEEILPPMLITPIKPKIEAAKTVL